MSEDASDEDWFERAVSDGDEDGDSGGRPAMTDEDENGDGATDAAATTAQDPDTHGETEAGLETDADPETDPDAVAEAAFEAAVESAGDEAAGDAGDDASVADSGGVNDAGGGVDSGGFGGEGASGFGSATDPDDDGSLFEDDFASAFESAGDAEFDDEEFESDIPRIDLGIEGLDGMIQGGVPERHLVVAIGSAGTGKTTFGLQFLHHGLQQGEDAVFITLEQSHDAILATAEERGWEFERYEDEDRLAVIDLDPVEMANSLDNIRAELPELVADFGADRLVLDSVSLLEMMYDDQSKRRTEVFDFTRSLKEAGVTTMLTSEANEDNPYASRHGIIEYLTDAVFILKYVRAETKETRLAVEIQKIRDANHSREMKPYEITMDGISVYQQANIF